MYLAELICNTEWEDIKPQPFLYYFASEEHTDKAATDFLILFSKLQRVAPIKSDMQIIIIKTDLLGDPYHIEEGDEIIHEVVGRNGTLNKEVKGFKYLGRLDDSKFTHRQADYCLCVTSWEKWLGMEINKQTLEHYTNSQIVARCMAEMTLMSFSQFEIRKEKEEIRQEVCKLDAMTEEEIRSIGNWGHIRTSLGKMLST
jgi:hypothetical protein